MLSRYYYERLQEGKKAQYLEILNGLSNRKEKIPIADPLQAEVIEAVKMDNPQLYYVDFSRWKCTETMKQRFLSPEYLYNRAEQENMDKRTDSLCQYFSALDGERYIRKVHNYFVKNVRYDEQEKLGKKFAENHTAAGPLCFGKGVCEGISLAFAYLLQKRGIDCTVAEGQSEDEGHMWNVVNLNGRNYHVDVTNDITQTEDQFGKPCYFYYLIKDEAMAKTVENVGQFHCIHSEDNPFYTSGKVFDDIRLKEYLRRVAPHESVVFFQYSGNRTADEIVKEYFACTQTGEPFSVRYMVDRTNSIFYFARQV